MASCMYCKTELDPQVVIDVCMSCGPQIWGGKMFASIIENMELARSTGNLNQGLVTEQESEKREIVEPYPSTSDDSSPTHFLLRESPEPASFQEPPPPPSPEPVPAPEPTPEPTPEAPEPEPRPEPEHTFTPQLTHESETNPLPKPTHTPEQKVEIPEGIRVPSLLQGAIQHQQEYPEEEPTDTYEEAERKLLEKQRSKEPEEHIQTSPTQQEPLDITNSGDGGENQLTGSDIDLIEPTENKPF